MTRIPSVMTQYRFDFKIEFSIESYGFDKKHAKEKALRCAQEQLKNSFLEHCLKVSKGRKTGDTV